MMLDLPFASRRQGQNRSNPPLIEREIAHRLPRGPAWGLGFPNRGVLRWQGEQHGERTAPLKPVLLERLVEFKHVSWYGRRAPTSGRKGVLEVTQTDGFQRVGVWIMELEPHGLRHVVEVDIRPAGT